MILIQCPYTQVHYVYSMFSSIFKNFIFILPMSFLDTHTYIYIYIYISLSSVQSVRQWSGIPGFNPSSHHTGDFENGI